LQRAATEAEAANSRRDHDLRMNPETATQNTQKQRDDKSAQNSSERRNDMRGTSAGR
jgi:hypothetical protein